MPTPYIPPQVSFTELVSPSFQPILDRPTTIALVGEAQNFFNASEAVSLIDSTPVARLAKRRNFQYSQRLQS
jgi:hypothetical protein